MESGVTGRGGDMEEGVTGRHGEGLPITPFSVSPRHPLSISFQTHTPHPTQVSCLIAYGLIFGVQLADYGIIVLFDSLTGNTMALQAKFLGLDRSVVSYR